MSKNRVEELEATVSELESTVRGLTEELVETKERVRALEDELEPDVAVSGLTRESADQSQSADERTSGSRSTSEQSEETAVEADKGDGSEEADETDDSELGDDIIVA